ncbi:MAG TPA: hypothetical protein DCG12_00495 [Planctomycetaceae bacterium]|nr:hypothetical protein [Planctomycetaceae bacterium]
MLSDTSDQGPIGDVANPRICLIRMTSSETMSAAQLPPFGLVTSLASPKNYWWPFCSHLKHSP